MYYPAIPAAQQPCSPADCVSGDLSCLASSPTENEANHLPSSIDSHTGLGLSYYLDFIIIRRKRQRKYLDIDRKLKHNTCLQDYGWIIFASSV